MLSFLRLPVLRALLAQGAAFALTVGLARLGWFHLDPWAWLGVEALLAIGLTAWAGLGRWWCAFNALLPFALQGASGAGLPPRAYLIALVLLALVFGGGLLTRVPLYNANRAAWRALEQRIPAEARTFVDLGCGLGGPLAHLARTRPDLALLGVEASPLTWLVAWLRCLPHRNVRIRLRSLWAVDLGTMDVAYAFLSPAPMPELWAKVRREMRPGTLFLSHTFAVPGQPEAWVQPLPGRSDACLRGWSL